MAYFNYKGKNIYYEEYGSGFPVIFLHGNSVSARMFSGVLDLYRNQYQVILIDFLGHGYSDRVENFNEDFWFDQAMQVIEFISQKNYNKVNLIGTSGGALTAINVALERPDLVNKIIADSLEGEETVEAFVVKLPEDREKNKNTDGVRWFWEYCHGEDWEQVVDNDTDVILRHGKRIKKFFHKELTCLAVPTMLSVSLKDDEYADIINIECVYRELGKKIPNSVIRFFPSGGHPAMITNAEEFARLVRVFFSNER